MKRREAKQTRELPAFSLARSAFVCVHTSTSLSCLGSGALEIGISSPSLIPLSLSRPPPAIENWDSSPSRRLVSPAAELARTSLRTRNGGHLPSPPPPLDPVLVRPRRPRRRGVQDRLRILRQPERAPGGRRNAPRGHARPFRSIGCDGDCFVQPIWDAVVGFRPQVFVWLGDNIYGDNKRPFRAFGRERTVGPWKNVPRFYPSTEEELRRRYHLARAQPGYARLRESAQVWPPSLYFSPPWTIAAARLICSSLIALSAFMSWPHRI